MSRTPIERNQPAPIAIRIFPRPPLQRVLALHLRAAIWRRMTTKFFLVDSSLRSINTVKLDTLAAIQSTNCRIRYYSSASEKDGNFIQVTEDEPPIVSTSSLLNPISTLSFPSGTGTPVDNVCPEGIVRALGRFPRKGGLPPLFVYMKNAVTVLTLSS